MNYICTWFCADEKGGESLFPQTGRLSSSAGHQNIYWRCILVFFVTSKRFNKKEKHLLFTNVRQLPVVDGRTVSDILDQLDVEVVFTDFKYKTPKGYFAAFQNQFYEFSILEHIATNSKNSKDHYLILDSDCIFIKPTLELFEAADPSGFISFHDDVAPDYVINGLSRNQLKAIYEELLGHTIKEIPAYHLGEFFLASVDNIRKIYNDFTGLWPQLIERYKLGKEKFNEEAHTLSYLYFKNGLRPSSHTQFMRRIWTNPLFYREVRKSDRELAIWHLPAEKTFGIYRLYDLFFNKSKNFHLDIDNEKFLKIVEDAVNVPELDIRAKMKYYTVSYCRALKKRINKVPLLAKFFTF
jgi:hypothetical protein